MPDNDQPNLPLDERFRQAEQFTLDLAPPAPQREAPKAVDYESCPHHKVFVYGCRYCDPR